MRIIKYVGLILLIAVTVVAVAPASAAPGATIVDITINEDACQMTVVFTVEDAAIYWLEVYDEGTLVWGAPFTQSAGATVTVVLHIGGPAVASDVGVALRDPVTNEFLDGNGSVIVPDCTGSWSVVSDAPGLCSNPQPQDYVVRPVPAGAVAYFAPASDKATNFSLPAGTWYTSPEPTNGFYEVWIACEASPIFIAAESVG